MGHVANLSSLEVPELPQLAFAVLISETEPAKVIHGSSTEVGTNWICDGVWDGEFPLGPQRNSFMFGNAVAFEDDEVTLMSSCSPADRLFVTEIPSGVLVSNSLPLILSCTGDGLDPTWPWYRARMLAAEHGFSAAKRTIPTKSGRSIRVMWNEVAQYKNGSISYKYRSAARPFDSYEAYLAALKAMLASLVDNARSSARSMPLKVIPSLSSGYDSTAVAVLASELGIKTAYTLERFSPDDPSVPVDCPNAVADALGIDVQGFPRDVWKRGGDGCDADIAAAAVSFLDVVFLGYQNVVGNTALLLGQYGDNVWDKNNFRISTDIQQSFGYMDGRSLAEHRLRFGYAVIAPAMIYHSTQPSLFRVSNSREMQPWSIGGSYDRPIPRRIAEEAGIARGSFATKKYGGSGRVGTTITRYSGVTRAERDAELCESMTTAGAADFLDFIEDLETKGIVSLGSGPLRWKLRLGSAGYWLYGKLDALDFHVGKRLHRFGVRYMAPRWFMRRLGEYCKIHPDYTYLLPHWGTARSAERYPSAMRFFEEAKPFDARQG